MGVVMGEAGIRTGLTHRHPDCLPRRPGEYPAFTEENEGEPQKFAISGGTGRYKTAHGVLKAVPTETGAHLTFRVIR